MQHRKTRVFADLGPTCCLDRHCSAVVAIAGLARVHGGVYKAKSINTPQQRERGTLVKGRLRAGVVVFSSGLRRPSQAEISRAERDGSIRAMTGGCRPGPDAQN